MRCPQCKNKLLHKSGDATLLRTHGPLVFEDGTCRSRCYYCKSDIDVPVRVETSAPQPKLVMRK